MADNGFKNVRTTASDAAVKLELVRELAYFVERGLEKFGSPASGLRLTALVNAIRANLGESLAQGTQEKLSQTELRTRLLEAYFDEFEADCQLYLKEKVAPMPVTRWEEEEQVITRRYGAPMAYQHRPQPSLDGALEMAWRNLRRAQQRWMAWLALGAMFWTTPEGRSSESAEAQDFETVSKALRIELRGMEKRLVMFALLKGGAEADKVREWLMATTLGERMSVMEYLEDDGNLPNSWRTADEAAFRESLKGW